jgi:hypothetical protein
MCVLVMKEVEGQGVPYKSIFPVEKPSSKRENNCQRCDSGVEYYGRGRRTGSAKACSTRLLRPLNAVEPPSLVNHISGENDRVGK